MGIRTGVTGFFTLVIGSPILFIFTIFTCLYLIYTIFYIFTSSAPNAALSEELGVFSILLGLLSILYALYSTVSTTKKLDLAQKQLSDIQTDYWNTRGIDLYKQKQYRDADQSYERAINLNPHDAKVWMNIAASLYEQNKLDEALKAIDMAIEMDQSRSNSYNIKGLILRSKAIKDLEKQIELNSGLTEVRISKYEVPFDQTNVFIENYFELNNETSGAWNNEGEALLAQALIVLEKSIELQL